MNNSLDKILSAIPQSSRDPLFILEGNGKILYTNNQVEELLKISEPQKNIGDFFAKETKEKFNELLDRLIDRNELLEIDHFEFELSDGERIKAKVILNIIRSGEEYFILCTLIPINYNVDYKDKIRIGVKDINLNNLIRDKKVIEILEKVETLFPFTFIGYEIIHKLVNSIDDLFWIVDNSGKFLIVNNEFAKSIGLRPFQLEGKKAEEFIPAYIKELNLALEQFMKNTMSSVIMDSALFKEIKNQDGIEIVQLPLLDKEKNIQAIIGISQLKEMNYKFKHKDESFTTLYKIIDDFPKPVAFITSKGTIKHSSTGFCKLFNKKQEELNGLNFANIIHDTLAEGISRFLSSEDSERILPCNRQFEIEKNTEPDYTVYLTKFYGGENQFEGFSILIENIEYVENIQHLIKSRGRMFEFLIENNPEPVYIYDKENLRFLEVNQAAQDLYQYTKEEFQQLDLTDLYNPEDIQTLLGTSSEQLAEGKFSLPLRQKRKDGSTILVEVSKFSFKFNDRDAHFNIVKNVTDSLELEKNVQLFKAAFDNSANMIFVTDPDGIIKFVNSSATDILGLPKQDLENSSFASLSIDEDRTIINTSVFQSHLKEPISMIVQLKSLDNKLIETEITATPVLDFEKNVDSFVIIGKILTNKVDEEKPSEITKEVEKEKLSEAGSDNSVQLESAFLSGVFHEILTPMNVILGFAQELTEGIDNLTPDQKEAVEIINQNRGKLLSTMNAIIEYSEVQKKKDEWDISEITITKVVEELDKYIYEIIGSRDVEFAYGKISSSLQFSTDKTKFDCLLNNLIRLVSTLCQDNKIYFSSYPVDDDNFIIMLTDGYASASDYLANTLRKLFIDKREAKEIGVSKLGAQITRSLLDLLKGKFISSIDDSGKYECGFVFPINLMQSLKEETEPVVEEPVPEVESQVPIDTIEQEEPPVQDEVSAQSEEGIEIEEETEIPEKPVETSVPVDTEIQDEKEVNLEKIEEPETFQENIEKPKIQGPPAPRVEEPEEKPVEEKAEVPVTEETEKPVEAQEEVFEEVEEPKQVSAQSKVEEFSFEDESSNQEFQPSEDKLDLSGLSCLYIEDQVDSQILFKVQMKGLKNIKYAVSFEEALPFLDADHFDFIVMDINLQGEYNGLDALKIIHKMPGYEDIPIIAVTAYVLPGDKEKFIATGFNDFISKPIFREKMLESLEKIFLQKV